MSKPKGVYRFGYPSNMKKGDIAWIVRYATTFRKMMQSIRRAGEFDAQQQERGCCGKFDV